jgi:hypothetical protein
MSYPFFSGRCAPPPTHSTGTFMIGDCFGFAAGLDIETKEKASVPAANRIPFLNFETPGMILIYSCRVTAMSLFVAHNFHSVFDKYFPLGLKAFIEYRDLFFLFSAFSLAGNRFSL